MKKKGDHLRKRAPKLGDRDKLGNKMTSSKISSELDAKDHLYAAEGSFMLFETTEDNVKESNPTWYLRFDTASGAPGSRFEGGKSDESGGWVADILEGCGAIAYDDNGDTTCNLADMIMEHKGKDIVIVLAGCNQKDAHDIANLFAENAYVDGVVVAMLTYLDVDE